MKTIPGHLSISLDRLFSGDRVGLGQAMTLIESERPEDRDAALILLAQCEKKLQVSDNSLRIAISGAPGVGKSTLIENLGLKAIEKGHRVGVITIDPTSVLSKGSILGDKSRMSTLSTSPSAFIRSSPAGQVLGGLGRRTYELITLMAAVGYDLILVETVGVGQSEHMAWQLTDAFFLVIQPGGGDELQGIKRGITELADVIIVNKADGELTPFAKNTKVQYQNALHYFTPLREGWAPKALMCSALTGVGIDELLSIIAAYQTWLTTHNDRNDLRQHQQKAWLQWNLGMEAHHLMLQHPDIQRALSNADTYGQTGNNSIFKTASTIEHLMRSMISNYEQHTRS